MARSKPKYSRINLWIVAVVLFSSGAASAEPTEEECMNAASPNVYKALGCHERTAAREGTGETSTVTTQPAPLAKTTQSKRSKSDREIIEGLVIGMDYMERDLDSAQRQIKTLRQEVATLHRGSCEGQKAGRYAILAAAAPLIGGVVAAIVWETPEFAYLGVGAGVLPAGLVGGGVETCSTWLVGTGTMVSLASTIALMRFAALGARF